MKTKSVDLGALQDDLIAAQKQFEDDKKILERAQQAFVISKARYSDALEALGNATRVVLGT